MHLDFSAALDSLQAMFDGLVARIPFVLVGVFVFVLFVLLARGLATLIEHYTQRRRRHRNLAQVFGRLTRAGLILVGLLIALVIVFPSFTIGRLVELLGISGVAIGFAFRDILQNFLAGILLLITEPFKAGDQIIFGSYEGTVEDVQTRATFIRTYDNRLVVVPNGDLFTQSVLVNTAYETRRIEYDIGIGYGDDVELARRLILEALRGLPDVLNEPQPDVLVYELAESTVNLRIRWWIIPPRRIDSLNTRDHVLTAIKQALTAHGIDLPFPTQVLLFHDQTEATDGDRARQREGWPAGNQPVPAPLTLSRALRQSIAAARDGEGE